MIEHEPSSVPEEIQQAFKKRVSDWSINADYPWQTRRVFSGYSSGFGLEDYKRPTLYVCPETLSVKSRKTPEFSGERIDTAYFQFDLAIEGMFKPESILTINKARFGNDVNRLILVSDTGVGDTAVAQSLDVKLQGITQIEAHYDGIGKPGPLINYHLDLAYYVPHDKPREADYLQLSEDPIRNFKISDLLASDPEIRFQGRFRVEEAVIDGANLQSLMAGENVDNYYGSWTTLDGKVRFRPKGETVWHAELYFPKVLPQDLSRSLVDRRTESYPLTAPHSLDRSWRNTQVFSGIGISTGYNDREKPDFYRFPFL